MVLGSFKSKSKTGDDKNDGKSETEQVKQSKEKVAQKESAIKKRTMAGKVTRNPFLNFLRAFRMQHFDWTVPKLTSEGARVWAAMAPKEKEKYILQAIKAPRIKRQRKLETNYKYKTSARRRRSRSSSSRRRRKRGSRSRRRGSSRRSRRRRSRR